MSSKLYQQDRQVEAMKELLNHYEMLLIEDEGSSGVCPLCSVLPFNTCKKCVWVKETGEPCWISKDEDKDFKKYDVPQLRRGEFSVPDYIHKKWVEKRIKELKEWIEKYYK